MIYMIGYILCGMCSLIFIELFILKSNANPNGYIIFAFNANKHKTIKDLLMETTSEPYYFLMVIFWPLIIIAFLTVELVAIVFSVYRLIGLKKLFNTIGDIKLSKEETNE